MRYFILLIFLNLLLMANTNRITTSDGITCESTSESPYEIESYIEASSNDFDSTSQDNGFDNKTDSTKTLGLRFTYKFGKQATLNCEKLYNLELRAKEARVKELENKIKALETVNSINWEQNNDK